LIAVLGRHHGLLYMVHDGVMNHIADTDEPLTETILPDESAPGASSINFELNKPVITETKEVTLVSVLPQPTSTNTLSLDDYRFRFAIRERGTLE